MEHPTIVYAALGTNLGDKLAHLEAALALVHARAGPVTATSRLYQTAPQYVEDQPAFFNIVVRLTTTLSPAGLLEVFKAIEREVGRTASFRYGPRVIDVDVLLYGDRVLQTETADGPLLVPHERLAERDFVLVPLCDLAPELVHPELGRTMRELLAVLQQTQQQPTPQPLLPVIKDAPWVLGSRTFIMGILNVTPDSFSDGGDEAMAVDGAVARALAMAAAGCDVIDVGGESTRPGAEPVTADEELRRVLPVIRGIRAQSPVAISIDTTKASVARAAIAAGANVVNDVSAGERDPEMLATVAELRVPYVMMHMRGNPMTMTELKDYDDVVDAVGAYLNARVAAAAAAGIYAWNLIVDPGIGFAKGRELNLMVLRRLGELKQRQWCPGLPVLVGPSRKAFIGQICGRPEPRDRAWGTAATCAAAIQQGADLLRVHDVREMVDVARMSDAIWRGEGPNKQA